MTNREDKGDIEIFLQCEGVTEIQLIRVSQDGTLRDILRAALAGGIAIPQGGEGAVIFLEDSESELKLDARLKDVDVRHRVRLHCHRCRKVEVTINFNGAIKERYFPPSMTIAKVKRWADGEFGLKGVDATEHALQICGTNTRPDEDVHIGTLVQSSNCRLCFDLVPKKRVEG